MAQYCTFRVADLYFGVPVEQVGEVLRQQRVTRVPLADPMVRGLINLRGEIVTAVDLRRRLSLPGLAGSEDRMNLVLRRSDGSAVSLLVDSIGDVLELSDDLFEAPPVTLTGIAKTLVCRVCKLEGELLLVLDTVAAVLAEHERKEERAA
ncbi:MAG: chemotaxis protein CheW [Myxococcota bacterium]